MKKILTLAAMAALMVSALSCGNQGNKKAAVPAYKVVEAPQVDLSTFPVDEDGYIVLFDGSSTKGWRGYGKESLPQRWSIDEGALKFSGSGSVSGI